MRRWVADVRAPPLRDTAGARTSIAQPGTFYPGLWSLNPGVRESARACGGTLLGREQGPVAIRSGYRVMETVTPADVVGLPATSVATAVSVCCRTAALRTARTPSTSTSRWRARSRCPASWSRRRTRRARCRRGPGAGAQVLGGGADGHRARAAGDGGSPVGLVMLTVGAAASSRTVCERGVSSSPRCWSSSTAPSSSASPRTVRRTGPSTRWSSGRSRRSCSRWWSPIRPGRSP